MRGCVGWTRCAEKLAALLGQAVQEVEILLIGGAEALDEFSANRAEDLNGGGRLEPCKNADRGAGDAEKFAILERDDIRRARAFIDEGDFAEKVADLEIGQLDFSIWRRSLNDRRAV